MVDPAVRKKTMFTDALLTDLYQLTMAAGYLNRGKWAEPATFDL